MAPVSPLVSIIPSASTGPILALQRKRESSTVGQWGQAREGLNSDSATRSGESREVIGERAS